jgi:tryptophan aminotransferase
MYFGTGPRIPSYFMLEAQTGDRSVGRVLRFDSFSKVLSAGTRIGFVTGPAPVLDAIDRHVRTSNRFLGSLTWHCRQLRQTCNHHPSLRL